MNRDKITKILARENLSIARDLFAVACSHSRAHSHYASKALKDFGDHGAQISGCVRDHFPEPVKQQLRTLAQLVTKYSELGHAARPKGVRLDTMRHLARSVATRDGSGFYGPQPYRKG